ncbi:hypothetical protein CCYA_CCYA17G4314 [Cyanidiococcus yangmingshanensis]|nr:hypothetical protein CCYA_CCYA17G4314 [Cyanidiococcus yangmingshanensis]
MPKLRVGGVPEPFNEPFILARDLGVLSPQLEVEFQAVPGGSGAALSLVESGELDVAVALTESAVARKLRGTSKLLVHSVYVASPLIWGIAVSTRHSGFAGLHNLDENVRHSRKIRAGFSRTGSGSHLMLFVLGESRDWFRLKRPDEVFTFCEIGSFDGLVNAAAAGDIDIFLWESCFTRESAPVRQGLVQVLDEYAPPWPGFVLVCQDNSHVKSLLSSLKEALEPLQRKFCTHDGLNILQQKYNFSLESAKLWISRLAFAKPNEMLSADQWRRVSNVLDLAGASSRA